MSQGSRADRVADQLRSELGQLLTRDVHDPGIGFVTLTRVLLSGDLQLARVYYTVLGDDTARKNSARALERAAPFLRRQIGSRLRLKRVPELAFLYDESIAGQDRIERLLNELHAGAPGDHVEDIAARGPDDTAVDPSGRAHGTQSEQEPSPNRTEGGPPARTDDAGQ